MSVPIYQSNICIVAQYYLLLSQSMLLVSKACTNKFNIFRLCMFCIFILGPVQQNMITDGKDSSNKYSTGHPEYLFCNSEEVPSSHHEPEVQNLLHELSDVKSQMLTFAQSTNSSFGQFITLPSSQPSICDFHDVSAQMTQKYISSTTFYADDNAAFDDFSDTCYGRNAEHYSVVSQSTIAIDNQSTSSSATLDLDEPSFRACLENTNLSDIGSSVMAGDLDRSPTRDLLSDAFQLLQENGYLDNEQFVSLAFGSFPRTKSEFKQHFTAV